MATLMDIGLLKEFGDIFPFLLVFVLVYAILIKTPFFKDNKGLASLLGVIMGIMTLFSTIARETITVMAPWFVLLFIFIIFMLIAFMIFGTTESDVMSLLKSEKFGVGLWVVALVIIITVGSLMSVLSEHGGIGKAPAVLAEGVAEGEAPAQTSEFWDTLVNPKVLGLALLLMIASFTIKYMTMEGM